MLQRLTGFNPVPHNSYKAPSPNDSDVIDFSGTPHELKPSAPCSFYDSDRCPEAADVLVGSPFDRFQAPH